MLLDSQDNNVIKTIHVNSTILFKIFIDFNYNLRPKPYLNKENSDSKSE